MLPLLIELHNNKKIINMKGITSVSTLSGLLNSMEGSDIYYEHVCKITRLFTQFQYQQQLLKKFFQHLE